jgi:hypothetical protein
MAGQLADRDLYSGREHADQALNGVAQGLLEACAQVAMGNLNAEEEGEQLPLRDQQGGQNPGEIGIEVATSHTIILQWSVQPIAQKLDIVIHRATAHFEALAESPDRRITSLTNQGIHEHKALKPGRHHMRSRAPE